MSEVVEKVSNETNVMAAAPTATVASLIKKKEQIKNKTNKKAQLFVPSLGEKITVKTPDKPLVMEALKLDDDANEYLILECCVEPNFKDPTFLEEYECDTPLQVIAKIFDPGEVISIADHLGEMAGLNAKVTLVDQLKN